MTFESHSEVSRAFNSVSHFKLKPEPVLSCGHPGRRHRVKVAGRRHRPGGQVCRRLGLLVRVQVTRVTLGHNSMNLNADRRWRLECHRNLTRKAPFTH